MEDEKMPVAKQYLNLRDEEKYVLVRKEEDNVVMMDTQGELKDISAKDLRLWHKELGEVELTPGQVRVIENEVVEETPEQVQVVENEVVEETQTETEANEMLAEILDINKYEGKARKNIEHLDESGRQLLNVGLSMGYTIEVNGTYIGLKNDQGKLVGRLIPVKKGNRLYTFESKLTPILGKYKKGEITCLGRPVTGNTNAYVSLNLLNEAKMKHILETLDPATV